MAEPCPKLNKYAAESAHLPASERAAWHRRLAEWNAEAHWASHHGRLAVAVKADPLAAAAHRALAAAFAPGARRDG